MNLFQIIIVQIQARCIKDHIEKIPKKQLHLEQL